MKNVVFDIEANGLAELVIDKKKRTVAEATRIHLLVLRCLDTNRVEVHREDTIQEGWGRLMQADLIVGHNIIASDLPILRRLAGKIALGPRVFDTLVAARLLWPDAQNHPHKGNGLDDLSRAAGGVVKMDYDGPWDEWSQEMEDYCIGDTAATRDVFRWLVPKLRSFKLPLRVEHKVATIIAAQQDNGVRIDTVACEALIERLERVKAGTLDRLQQSFPPIIHERVSEKTGKRLKDRVEVFNPGSAQQVAARLKAKYGWDAPLTDKGNPSITEDTLLALEFPEALDLYQCGQAEKRLEHLTDWARRARESRTPGIIHPQINTCGCTTSRMSHQQPNQTACPKVQIDKATKRPKLEWDGRWGHECRSLWGPTREGWVQWGADAAGLEFRMLANRMWPWDKGAYSKVVTEGDVHAVNMAASQCDTREQTKETGYAFLYGAGDEKIGITKGAHPSLSKEQRQRYNKLLLTEKGRKKIGREFRDNLRRGLPALGKLIDYVQQASAERGYLVLLDGRHAPIRKAYAALNTQLQGDGAVVMKVALCLCHDRITAHGLTWGKDFAFMLNAHDEFQGEARSEEVAIHCGESAVWAIQEAGRRLKCKTPLDGEFKVGRSWAECH